MHLYTGDQIESARGPVRMHDTFDPKHAVHGECHLTTLSAGLALP